MSRPEKKEQFAVAEWLDWKGLVWIHVSHEGKRHAKYAEDLKRAGLKSGFPDVAIFEAPPKYPDKKGVAIELKREDGYPSDLRDSQREWLEKLENCGWWTGVCFGADDAIETLEELGY